MKRMLSQLGPVACLLLLPLRGSGQAVTITPAPGVRATSLPTLEFVGEYRCTQSTCPKPGDFGSSALVTAGTGSSFAVLTNTEPNVRVWDLGSGSASQFSVMAHPDLDSRIRSFAGFALVGDSVIVAGMNGLERATAKFTVAGQPLGRVPLSPAPADGRVSQSGYEASPSGKWILHRQFQSIGVGTNAYSSSSAWVRTNRATGESEVFDAPASLFAGSAPRLADPTAAGAISDDGTVAFGSAAVGYRLVLVPVGVGPRVEGGRSIPRPPWSAAQRARILSKALPSAVDGTPQFRSPDDPQITAGQEHFTFGALQFDAKGRLWVVTNRGSDAPRTSVIDVFSPTLEYLGEVTIDGYLSYHYDFGPQLMVARMSDEQGGLYVKVWRIREP